MSNSDEKGNVNEACSFDEVLDKELKSISVRRGETTPTHERSPQAKALEQNLVSLSFSGGGIRSATFNLGVLQGLARFRPSEGKATGFLKIIDYLSSVSGGSYIASWFSAWVYREHKKQKLAKHHKKGIEIVEEELAKSKDEPHPIQWLRRYSNYLAPRLGLLSADAWTLVSIYVRNLLLTLSVLLPFLFGVILVPRISLALFGIQYDQASEFVPFVVGVFLLLLFLTFCRITRSLFVNEEHEQLSNREKNLQGNGSKSGIQRSEGGLFGMNLLMIFLSVCGLLACWLISVPVCEKTTRFELWLHSAGFDDANWILETYGAWVFSATFAVLHFIPYVWYSFKISIKLKSLKPFHRYGWWIVVSIISGGAGGFLLYKLLFGLLGPWSKSDPQLVAAFGPALTFAVFLAGVVIEIGLICRKTSAQSREWWASLGAWMLIWGLGWTGISVLALYAYPIVVSIPAIISYIAGAGWLASAFGGALAGSKNNPTNGKPSLILRIVTTLAPIIAIIGLIILLSLASLQLVGGGLDSCNIKHYWVQLRDMNPLILIFWCLVAFGVSIVLSRIIDVNITSIHNLYANRLVRCYLGASNLYRQPNLLTGFDPCDEFPISRLKNSSGPLHIVNTAINLVGGKQLAWQDRKATSFVLTPLHCGYEPSKEPKPGEPVQPKKVAEPAYRPLPGYGRDLKLGTAVAISGAAASPSMGYHSSPTMAVLMTVLNVRLGWWLGNPKSLKKESWAYKLLCFMVGVDTPQHAWKTRGPKFGLKYLLSELLSQTDDEKSYVYLSDGGHFENLGVYELIRRRCRFIIACDAEADGKYEFHGLAGLIRKCRIDFGVEIEIDISGIVPHPKKKHRDPLHKRGFNRQNFALGLIHYPEKTGGSKKRANEGDEYGLLIYIKSSLPFDISTDVYQYAKTHNTFPHQTTADQFFDESQFESYRKLGEIIAGQVFQALFDAVLPDPEAIKTRATKSGESDSEKTEKGTTDKGKTEKSISKLLPESMQKNCPKIAELVNKLKDHREKVYPPPQK